MQKNDELFSQIDENISVSRSQIITAKEFILKRCKEGVTTRSSSMFSSFLVSIGALPPETVIIHSSIDSSTTIKQVINHISWCLAFSEAMWSLIHNNLLLPLDGSLYIKEPVVSWTTVYQGSGGNSAGWKFPKYKYSFPDFIIIAKSQSGSQNYLIDPDLYLNKLDIVNMKDDVKEALHDAILCFRSELYTPCLAMLTKAIEGAWIELGIALIKSRSDEQQRKLIKQSETLTSEYSSVVKIIHTVLDLYEKQDVFGDLSKDTGIKIDDLRNSVIWADCVRESRNDVHYGKELVLPNDFEKVSTLLLSAPAHFKMIYKLISVCEG